MQIPSIGLDVLLHGTRNGPHQMMLTRRLRLSDCDLLSYAKPEKLKAEGKVWQTVFYFFGHRLPLAIILEFLPPQPAPRDK